MPWKRMLAYLTGSVNEDLLRRIEYLLEETFQSSGWHLTFHRWQIGFRNPRLADTQTAHS